MKTLIIFSLGILISVSAFGQDIHRAYFALNEKDSKIEVTVTMNKVAMEAAMEEEGTCAGGIELKWCSVAYVQTHMEFKMDGYLAELNYVGEQEVGEDYVLTFTTNELYSKPASIDLKANCFQNNSGTSPEAPAQEYENIVEFNLFGVSEKVTLNSEKGSVAQKF